MQIHDNRTEFLCNVQYHRNKDIKHIAIYIWGRKNKEKENTGWEEHRKKINQGRENNEKQTNTKNRIKCV